MKREFRCPECGSSQTRGRVRTDDWFCNTCKHTWKIVVKEEETHMKEETEFNG